VEGPICKLCHIYKSLYLQSIFVPSFLLFPLSVFFVYVISPLNTLFLSVYFFLCVIAMKGKKIDFEEISSKKKAMLVSNSPSRTVHKCVQDICVEFYTQCTKFKKITFQEHSIPFSNYDCRIFGVLTFHPCTESNFHRQDIYAPYQS